MSALTEFQERLKERIKGDIGELMPDEVIKEMIQKVLDDEFVKPREVPNSDTSWHAKKTIQKPPLLMEYMGEQIQSIMKRCISEYFVANPGKLERIIEDQIGNQIGDFLAKVIASFIGEQFSLFKINVVSQLQKNIDRGY